jgi:hypothetical protein
VEAKGGTVTLKSITGREKPAADFIKAEKRAKKREALAAKAQVKSGKKAKVEEQEGAAEAEAPKAKKAKPEGKAEQGEARPEKAKPAKKDKSE